MEINYYQEAKQREEEIKEIYRYLHQRPELSWDEKKTQRWILERLSAWGVECRPCADTGVYAVIRSGKKGHTIAFRADMDALPVEEKTGLPFQSRQTGVMHACGHDAHMAVLLGCIKILQKMRGNLVGNAVFLFQPSEEKNGGAMRMIQEDVLENPRVELIAAFHMWGQEAHTITCIPGPVMARPDAFRIEVVGKGGHGAAPDMTRNPVSALAAMIPLIERIPSAVLSPQDTAVVNVCHIQSGESYNVVADTGYLEGTIRTFDPSVREAIIRQLTEISESVPKAFKMQGRYSMDSGHPATVNDARAALWAADLIRQRMPEVEVITEAQPSMLGEDFSYFGQKIPALFMRLGCWPRERERHYPLHHCQFQIDESVLADGVSVYCTIADAFMKEGERK